MCPVVNVSSVEQKGTLVCQEKKQKKTRVNCALLSDILMYRQYIIRLGRRVAVTFPTVQCDATLRLPQKRWGGLAWGRAGYHDVMTWT